MYLVNTRRSALSKCLLLIALVCLPQFAFASAGKVLFSVGDVQVDRGGLMPAKRGMEVLEGDRFITGAKGRAQLRMNDGAKIALRPNTEFVIEAFSLADTAEEAEAPASVGVTSEGREDEAVYNLLKGGFRTITGTIGKENEEEYRIKTPVATIGIRGTDFLVLLCEGDCSEQAGVSSESGLFVNVSSGHIVIVNEFGNIDVYGSETGFVGAGEAPVLLNVPVPPIFQDLPAPPPPKLDDDKVHGEGEEGSAGDEQQSEEGDSQQSDSTGGGSPTPPPAPKTAPAQAGATTPITAQDSTGNPVDLTDGQAEGDTSVVALSMSMAQFGESPNTAPSPGTGTGTSTSTGTSTGTGRLTGLPITVESFSPQSGVRLDTGGKIIEFQAQLSNELTTFSRNDAASLNEGFDSLTGLRWGRWSDGTLIVTHADGTTDTVDLTNQSLHFVATQAFVDPVMPVTGVASYTLVGNTDPTNANGAVGTLGSASLVANFSTQTVDSNLTATVAGEVWTASGVGQIGGNIPNGFDGEYTNVAIDNVAQGGGLFSGVFTPISGEDPAELPAGAGMTYFLEENLNQRIITGTAVFGDPGNL